MKNFFFFAIIVLISSGCGKDYPEHPFVKTNFPHNSTVRDIAIIDESTWIVSGGDEGSGIVAKTFDKGITWTTSTSTFEYAVSCLYFLNADTGFAGDEDIIIYKTTNGGQNWNPFYDTSWPLTVNRNLRSIWFTNDSTGFVCGGKNLGNGVLYDTKDGGSDWEFREFDHEYRGICFADEDNGIMCGYGSMLITKDGGQTFEITDNIKSYFTGICHDEMNQYWVCDFNGTIMNSNDKGKSWHDKRNSSSWNMSGAGLNCIDVSPRGRIISAGPNGFFTLSDDQGASWNDKTSFGGKDILKIKWISETEAVAVGKNGGVYSVKL